MIELSVTLDKADLARLAALKGKTRFAGALALTRTAQDAKDKLRATAGTYFHLRNSWVPQGIRIKAANKGGMNAQVGSVDKYMGRHVFGDPKPAKRSLSIRGKRDSHGKLASGGLLIKPYAGIASAPTHTVVRRQLSRIDGQKRKTFQIRGKGGSVLLVRRTSAKRFPLQTLAILKSGAHDRPIWPLLPIVQGVVSARFAVHFEAALGAL